MNIINIIPPPINIYIKKFPLNKSVNPPVKFSPIFNTFPNIPVIYPVNPPT